eukprot:1662449-Rhodomonas_salina.3
MPVPDKAQQLRSQIGPCTWHVELRQHSHSSLERVSDNVRDIGGRVRLLGRVCPVLGEEGSRGRVERKARGVNDVPM